MLDSETVWTINIRSLTLLVNSLDSQLSIRERDIIDTLNTLYDDNRDDDIDFDEFLYHLAQLTRVCQYPLYLLTYLLSLLHMSSTKCGRKKWPTEFLPPCQKWLGV